MSAILDFLRGDDPNPNGLTLYDILDYDDDQFESGHTHIQWMFPLPEPSKAQPSSPVATEQDYELIAMNPLYKARMLASLGRFVLFLDRTTLWRRSRDHNHLRITRVIRCLCWCGLNDVAFDFCEYVKSEVGQTVGKQTCWYWDEALKRDPEWLN